MKTFLLLVFCFSLVCISENIVAQVTKLSNNTNLNYAITLGNKALIATDDDSIWVTDGTASGTKKLVSNVSIADNNSAVVFKNKIYFPGKNAAKGTELWVSDCSAAGTKLFRDINPGAPGSSPTNFFVYNNTLFFFAITADNGNELWKSDGTASGTVMVKDILPGKSNSVDDNNPTFFFPAANVLFFMANDSVHGNELWKTTGTPGSTVMVKDLYPGKKSFEMDTYNSLNNMFVFSGKGSATKGINIWQSDGTKSGTAVIKTILPNNDNSSMSASNLSKFKDKLVFSVQGFDLVHFSFLSQLYITDATKPGTKLIIDLGDSSLAPAFGTLAPTLNDKFYFTTYTAIGGQSSLLWQSNGAPNGTKITKTIGTSLTNSQNIPIILTDLFTSDPDSLGTKNFNGKFFMAADDGVHGYEPWITDGTSSGTKQVKDIYQNTGSSLSLSTFTFVYSQKGLYFSANDNKTGNELWLSNGTAPGTKEVVDINPGKPGSNPLVAGFLNNHLLITADDGDNAQGKRDLYKVNATFDALPFTAADAVKVNIAPDGTSFSVYPNPAKDQLNVVLNKNLNSQHVSFVITDQKGRQLYANEISGMQASSNYKIDISRFALGTYYLEVRTDKGVVSTEFVKIK